ncbi:hypothetical protein Ahy_A10g049525 [Arachis hypogaea]|uniref:TTF-type domain-containing protein n=1 Tax=Arachis hypogaea TaxID=3818 RepID=A0A445B7C4_ARAHY|nr:hypothetical protein Ahy_A10g049525 [Arachis hypogaea]
MDEYSLSDLESHLQYSSEVDATFCLPCYLFSKKSSPFTGGFYNWKKVNNRKNSAFFSHVDKSLNYPRNIVVKSYKDLLNQLCHIDKVLAKSSSQQVLNCILKPLLIPSDVLKFLASYNKEVDVVVLKTALQNAIKIQNKILNKIGDAKFCLMVDGVRDESKREQMALVIRFMINMNLSRKG